MRLQPPQNDSGGFPCASLEGMSISKKGLWPLCLMMVLQIKAGKLLPMASVVILQALEAIQPLLQLFNCAVEQKQPQTVINEHGHVPIIRYLQNQAAGQI